MAPTTAQNPWKDLLWNVSLLPTVRAATPIGPPSGPGPATVNALGAPALLSVCEDTTRHALPEAA
jgi:hypothetical protein